MGNFNPIGCAVLVGVSAVSLAIWVPMYMDINEYPSHLEARKRLVNFSKHCAFLNARGESANLADLNLAELKKPLKGSDGDYRILIDENKVNKPCSKSVLTAVPSNPRLPKFSIELGGIKTSCILGQPSNKIYADICRDGSWETRADRM